MIIKGLNDEYRDHVENLYPRDSECLLTKTSDEIWDFFEHLAQET